MRAASWANSCRVVSQPRTNHRQRQVYISFKGCSLHAWRAFWPHGWTRVLELNQRFHAAIHHALNSLYSESSHAGPSTIVCQVHAPTVQRRDESNKSQRFCPFPPRILYSFGVTISTSGHLPFSKMFTHMTRNYTPCLGFRVLN